MQVVRDELAGTYTFFPADQEEEEIIRGIAALEPSTKLEYAGCEIDESGGRRIVTFGYGGKWGRRTESSANGKCTFSHPEYAGGTKVVLQGTTEEDKNSFGVLRDTCYFGDGSSLIFLRTASLDDGRSGVVMTAILCTKCGSPAINLVACEWGICNACALVCEHQYIRGMIHGGGTNAGMGNFCSICGRTNPADTGDSKKSVLGQHLDVEREIGIELIDKTSGLRPGQIVKLSRFTRRLLRARARG
jgi:hypothetical protein